MRSKILVVGAKGELGKRLTGLFEADGHEVRCAVPSEAGEQVGALCVAYWEDRQSCPVEFIRDYQAGHPRSYLMCCSAQQDPWARSFLLDAGVTPDVVVTGLFADDAVLSEANRLLAFEHSDDTEHLVVCVDDDDGFLWSLEQCLPTRLASKTPFGTAFEFFDDPKQAIKLLADCGRSGTPVAMVISDEVMPEISGVELLNRAKELTPFAVRVLLTGQAGMADIVQAVNNRSLDHYISKPIEDVDHMTRTLGHLLNEYYLAGKARMDSWQVYEQYQFLKGLTKGQTLEGTLQAVVDFVAHTLSSERVSVMLCESDQLTIRASRGVPEDVVRSTSVPVGSGIAGRVFETGWPVYVTDRSEAGGESAVDSPYSVFASVPLLLAPMSVAGQPLGIINVTNRLEDKPLTHREMMFLSHTAEAASIAISSHQERRRREEANFATVKSLVLAVEAKDKYTRGHSERVALRSVQVAKILGLQPAEIDDLERGAIMHDVGKIGVPESIIHKPSKLTEDEFEQIRLHPAVGEHIVSQLAFMAGSLHAIRSHHERLDGGGYPDGLRGDEVPLFARIVGAADAYDAMTSERPYRRPMSRADAVAELQRCSGTQFDPDCVAALAQVVQHEDLGAVAAVPGAS